MIERVQLLEMMNRQMLDFDHIPIERHWDMSIRLHHELRHLGSWELCTAGCDELASDLIRMLFDRKVAS